MPGNFFLDSPLFVWGIMPFLIFLARVCDVSIGTVRIMLLSRGNRILAPLIGFFEVMIWLLAIRQIMFNLTNWTCYVGFAAGFAMGNYVGMVMEEKLAVGEQVIQIITRNAPELIRSLQAKGFGVTVLDAEGRRGKVNIIFTIFKRRDRHRVLESIREFNPKAFYTIEDVRSVREGIFPQPQSNYPDRMGSDEKLG